MAAGSVRRRHARGCPATAREGRCRCTGGYQIRYRDQLGVRREEGGFATKAEAERRLRERLGEIDHGTFRVLEPIGFARFAERWLETYAAPNVKPATLKDYRSVVANHLVPYFGDVALQRITREMVQRYLADKAGHRRPDGSPTWSAKTINNTLVPLKEMLSHAVEWGYLATSPATRVKPLRSETPEREILAPEDLQAVLTAAEGQLGLLVQIAAFCGLRRGELLGLRWGDLELERRRLHVRQTFGTHGFGSPKSRAGRRVVPLTPGIVAELRRHKLAQPPNEHDLVFASSVGTPIDPRNLTTAWYRLLRKAGVRQLGFHALRHTAVSLLIAHERLNPKQLSAMIGHASIQLTYDTYGHLMPDAFEGFGAVLDGLVSAGSEPPLGDLRGHSGVTGSGFPASAELRA